MTTSPVTSTHASPAPLKKRRRLPVSLSPSIAEDKPHTREPSTDQPPSMFVTNASTLAHSQPPMVPLPSPMMPYPPHLVPVMPSSYYHLYHQSPFYLPVTPPPAPPPLSPSSDKSYHPRSSPSSGNPRILPKTDPAQVTLGQSMHPIQSRYSAAHHYYHPYTLQLSPQLHPTAMMPVSPGTYVRHNSLSGTSGLELGLSLVEQREKARKVSHSAIERRRRERINDKILQLKQLIPSCADQGNLHKMSILQNAIDYITYLKQTVEKLDGNQHRLQGDHLLIKTNKSMLPKEVEPFTTQFSIAKDNWSMSSGDSPPPSMDEKSTGAIDDLHAPEEDEEEAQPSSSLNYTEETRSASLHGVLSQSLDESVRSKALKPSDLMNFTLCDSLLPAHHQPSAHHKSVDRISDSFTEVTGYEEQNIRHEARHERLASDDKELSPSHSISPLPTPRMTPKPSLTTDSDYPKHMSVENLLC